MRDKNFDVDLLKTLNGQPMPETPLFMGIDGVMYAGPIADGAAAIVCGLFTVRELRELTRLQQKTEKTN